MIPDEMKHLEADHMKDALEMPDPWDGKDGNADGHDDNSADFKWPFFPNPLRYSVD